MYCSGCGYGLAASTMICPACGRSTGVRPAGPSRSNFPVQTLAAVPGIRVSYAGFWMRFLAWMIDGALLTGIAFIVLGRLVNLARVGGIFGSLEPLDELDNLDDWYAVLGLGGTIAFAHFYILVSWLYHAFMESSAWQGTIGKRALGIVVTDANGARINFGRASGRFFSRLVSNMIPLGIGYILAGFTRQKQALHDLISNCLVLRKTS